MPGNVKPDDERVLVRNQPTPEGIEAGGHLARLADVAMAKALEQFPNHAERCGTCAFRGGTFPNGCVDTVMDALKCVIEAVPFYCHETRKGAARPLCAGFAACAAATIDKPIGRAPWPWSDGRESIE